MNHEGKPALLAGEGSAGVDALTATACRGFAAGLPTIEAPEVIRVVGVQSEADGQWRPSKSQHTLKKWLDIKSFYLLTRTRVVVGDWESEHNHDRQHPSLGSPDPADCAWPHTCAVSTDDSHNWSTESQGMPTHRAISEKVSRPLSACVRQR